MLIRDRRLWDAVTKYHPRIELVNDPASLIARQRQAPVLG